jgi:hypothetical protein
MLRKVRSTFHCNLPTGLRQSGLFGVHYGGIVSEGRVGDEIQSEAAERSNDLTPKATTVALKEGVS